MDTDVMCSVCSDGLFHEGEVVSTSCRHVFHEKCLGEWIKRSKTCPECRGLLKEPAQRLYFRSEPKERLFKEREEMFQNQVIALRNELEAQKKRYEEQLLAEVQIREAIHNQNRKLQEEIAKFANLPSVVQPNPVKLEQPLFAQSRWSMNGRESPV